MVPEPKPYNPAEALSQLQPAKVIDAPPCKQPAKRNAVWIKAETTEPEEKVTTYDKAKQAGGFGMHYHKFPRLSWLTMAEHKLYLELQKKYVTPALGAHQSKQPSELKQFQKFKVSRQCRCSITWKSHPDFLKFAQSEVKDLYLFMDFHDFFL